MVEYYDRYERRAPRSREATLLRDLRGILSVGKSRSAVLRSQLKGIDVDALRTRADLARIPLLRKTELASRQKEAPPFGGAAATRAGALDHLLMSRDGMFHPQGHAKDWWNSARALFAAGVRKGDIVINCFSYQFEPEAQMIESGARALGCPVVPAGNSDSGAIVTAVHHYQPVAYCGPAAYLKDLLASREAEQKITSVRRAFVLAAEPAARHADLSAHGIATFGAYATGDLGVVAYETEAREALIVNEGLIVEIVKPLSSEPQSPGQIGEIVVTRLNADYPLLRFATGVLSYAIVGQSPCGRTNMRIRAPLGKVEDGIEVAGAFVAPAHVVEIAVRHPDSPRLRLVIRARDQIVLQVEDGDRTPSRERLAETLFAVTKIKGAVELVPKDSLRESDKLLADERPKKD